MDSIDIYELREWQAFYEIEGGFGDLKQDYRIGQLTAILAETHRNKKARRHPYSAKEFALRPRTIPKNSQQKIRSALDRLAR